MPAAANLLILAGLLLMFTTGYATVLTPRLSRTRMATALFIAPAGVAVALAAVAVAHRSWWDLVTAVILAAGTAGMWEMHRAARAGRPSRLVRWQINRTLARKRGGRELWTLAQVRAEYAQTILDDADRDPALAEMLDGYAAQIAERVKGPGGQPRIGAADALAAYANGYLDSLSEPGRQPLGPGYRGYSTEMLMVAAVCRAAELLRAA